MVLKRIQSKINRLRCSLNPVEYARSLGVQIGEGTRFYGATPKTFSTEPWVIKIGRNCKITSEVMFLTHDGGTLAVENEIGRFVVVGDIVLEDNVYIGIRSILLPGIHIGENAIIGAGSVVSKDIPANCVAAGVPCRVIKTKEAYIDKVKGIMSGNNQRYYSDLEYLHRLNPKNPANKGKK